jgi:hypothetical protein
VLNIRRVRVGTSQLQICYPGHPLQKAMLMSRPETQLLASMSRFEHGKLMVASTQLLRSVMRVGDTTSARHGRYRRRMLDELSAALGT